MPVRVRRRFGWASFGVLAMVGAFAVSASAQTVTLPAADTTLRAGTYDATNFGGDADIETKASLDASTIRRTLLKFDTHTTIPAGSTINSATVTLTVHTGNSSLRHLAVYCVPSSFSEFQTTWKLRNATTPWTTPGGDVVHQHGVATVTNVTGSKVTIDVTGITREAMQTSSRYTRVLLVDIDGTSAPSWTAYYSNQSSASLAPKLVVNYGTTVVTTQPPPPPPVTTTTGTTLKVLQWNIQQGWTTNGKPNLDLVVAWVVKMNPDVISFNEIMHYESATADHVKIIADKLKAKTGQTWSYKWVQKWGAVSGEGEAVMSRLPFVSTASYLLPVQRSVAEALVMVNGRAVNVFSTHLDANSTTYRLSQIAALKPFATTFAQQRIIMGDFNAWPGTSEYGNMTKDFHDGWAEALKISTAVAYADNPNGNTRRSRIDYVWYSMGATSLVLKKAQVFDTRDAAGVRPSDHNPLVATFEVR
jgi:endonuclease/exonuclease/phosphatase family metal-dependent hydrolase